jgi:hypothetical protein
MFRFDTSISSAVETDGASSRQPGTVTNGPLTAEMLDRMNRYWQAANYLTLGQIYLQENPLLRQPLRPEHIKSNLLEHWGTSPGLSLIRRREPIRLSPSEVLRLLTVGSPRRVSLKNRLQNRAARRDSRDSQNSAPNTRNRCDKLVNEGE